MAYHSVLRRAVVARLKSVPALADKTFTSPPANFKPPVMVLGSIVASEALAKDSDAAYYDFAVDSWAQTNSPLDLDTLSDAAAQALAPAKGELGPGLGAPFLLAEVDAYNPDEPGGPILSRTQTFRTLCQPAL